ncbi:MAG: hypothetical protein IKC38_07010 [Clostridia bacterium]|nr:hypothetical protein [Clostridia bacterium]
MTDTKKNILELRKALPGLKERIAAVAFMLVLSLVMISATSYAWYTMASAPEVSNVSTTVSANGNLEIALSDLDGLAPDSTKIGDSKKGVMESNLAWSNLLNLSGNYGIENLILRPATFTTSSKYFLSSVSYTDGGRVEGETTNFGFTQWTVVDAQLGYYDFVVPSTTTYGVRAISSVAYANTGLTILQDKLEVAKDKAKIATDGYQAVMNNKGYVDTIRDVVQIYLHYNIYDVVANHPTYGGLAGLILPSLGISKDSTLSKAQITQLYNMFFELYNNAIYPFGDALAYLANIQQSLKGTEYTEYTRQSLMNASEASLKANGVELGTVLKTYKDLEAHFFADLGTMETYLQRVNNGDTIELRDETELLLIVNTLLDIDTVTINNGVQTQSVAALMSGGVDVALSFLGDITKDDQVLEVVATNGSLKQFEDMTGVRMDVSLYPLNLKVEILGIGGGGKKLTGHLTTNSNTNEFLGLVQKTMEMDANFASSMVAQDTYGMVLDLWFRTNAEDSVLTLDGLVSTETISEQRKVVLSGESVSREVFVYNRITGEVVGGIEATEEVLVYLAEDGQYYTISDRTLVKRAVVKEYTKDQNGNPILDENGNPTTIKVVEETDPITSEDVTPKMDSKVIVTGFNGSNRVYDDLYVESGETSATQGSGSCFIFYADTPESAAASLEMLKNLKIAFVCAEGELLAEAEFDVDMVFADSGKYIVPIYVSSLGCEYTDANGNISNGIVKLEKNVATRISVVLYLEGTDLDNSMAMSNGSIQGNLNFQFGSSADLTALKNTDLSMQTMSFSAEISDNKFTYDGVAKNPVLTAYIEGLSIGEGTLVQAIFQRQINSSQGMRTNPITLTNTSGTVWSGECNFTMPGTYVLKSLWVGGVEYALPQQYWITVEVSGFAVEAVNFCNLVGEEIALTAENYVTRSVAVKFDSNLMPTRVSARIVSAEGTYITCDLAYDALTRQWTGNAGFTTSGTYTIQYLVIGVGEGATYEEAYYELDEAFQSTFTAYLGLQARVYLDNGSSDISFDYQGARTIGVSVQILTNTGNALNSLPYDITLYYGKRGSTVSANGLQTTLTWSEGSYEGTFNIDKVGVFNFTKLVVGTNTITIATGAPGIAARSIDPPEYLGTTSQNSYFVQTSASVDFAANITNADGAASVKAVFVNSPTGKTYEVSVDKVEDGNYYFPVPKEDGSRHGIWTVREILIDGVYDPQGNYYGTDDENAIAQYYKLNVGHQMSIFEGFTMDINPITFSGIDFMTEVDLGKYTDNSDGSKNGLWINIREKIGFTMAEAGVTIQSVTLTLTHSGDSLEKGGYTISGTSRYQSLSYTWQNATTGHMYIPESGMTTGLAGSYNGTIKVTLSNGTSYEYRENNVLTVASKIPTVKITSASYASESSQGSATITDTNTTIYFHKYTESNGCSETTKYHHPSVTMNLAGMGSATGAKIKFETDNAAGVYMYADGVQTDSFEWKSDGDVMRNIGRLYSNDQSKEAALILTGSYLELTDSANCTYIFDIADIVINNPS